MKLFILRHGEAPYNREAEERILSERGAQKTHRVVTQNQAKLADVTHIVCSPVRRARETLSVLTQALNYQGKLSFDDCLRSESSLHAVESFVEQCQDPCLLLLSHQPLVGEIVDYLANQPGLGYQMGTSCLADFDLITFSRGCGQLNTIATPDAD